MCVVSFFRRWVWYLCVCGLLCVGFATDPEASSVYICKLEAKVLKRLGAPKLVERGSAARSLRVVLKVRRLLSSRRKATCRRMVGKVYRVAKLRFAAPQHLKLLRVGGIIHVDFRHIFPRPRPGRKYRSYKRWSFVIKPGTPRSKIVGAKKLSPRYAKKSVAKRVVLRWLKSRRSKNGSFYTFGLKQKGTKGAFVLKCKRGKGCDPKACVLVSTFSAGLHLTVKLSGAVLKAKVRANLKPLTREISPLPMATLLTYKGWELGPSGVDDMVQVNTAQVPYVRLHKRRVKGAFFLEYGGLSAELLSDPFCKDSPDDPEVNSHPACSFKLKGKYRFKFVFDIGLHPTTLRCMRSLRSKGKARR